MQLETNKNKMPAKKYFDPSVIPKSLLSEEEKKKLRSDLKVVYTENYYRLAKSCRVGSGRLPIPAVLIEGMYGPTDRNRIKELSYEDNLKSGRTLQLNSIQAVVYDMLGHQNLIRTVLDLIISDLFELSKAKKRDELDLPQYAEMCARVPTEMLTDTVALKLEEAMLGNRTVQKIFKRQLPSKMSLDNLLAVRATTLTADDMTSTAFSARKLLKRRLTQELKSYEHRVKAYKDGLISKDDPKTIKALESIEALQDKLNKIDDKVKGIVTLTSLVTHDPKTGETAYMNKEDFE